MAAARFADTNVLLYAVSTHPAEVDKAGRAAEVLEDHEIRLSVQVLQEFYVQATRATRPDRLSEDQARGLVEAFLRFDTLDITKDLLLAAMATAARYRISYWDAAIIEAARLSGCTTVLSEDLDEGTDYGGVRIDNPFRDLP